MLDANILVRAVLGVRVRGLIEQYAAAVELFVPDAAIGEVLEHLPAIYAKRRLSADRAMAVFEQLRVFIHELPLPFYADLEGRARARLVGSDPEDWPVTT